MFIRRLRELAVPNIRLFTRYHRKMFASIWSRGDFTTRVRALVSTARESLRFFLDDAGASWGIASTAADELRLLVAELREHDIRFDIARSKRIFQTMLERTGLRDEIGADTIFVSIRSASASWHPEFR